MDYAKIKVAAEGPVTVVTLADPATMNAAGVDTAGELRHAFDEATKAGSATRCIVLTGEGRGFCSGANLSGGGAGGGGDAGSSLESVYNPLVTAIRDLSVPLVTAVNGAAAGVGCSLALLGDLIVAGESAYFLQAFRRIGLIPDGGSTYLLPRMVGRARAMEMALLGERVSAAKALEWGMINRCVPDAELMPTAMALADELARGPASLGLTRQTIWAGLDSEWSDQLRREAQGQTKAGRTEDFREGVAAFLQKRPAQFKGK
ncbi:MAG TPA: enoyl-CoA hydratase/isomerase [Caulobacteraceae bacterium]|jgi:2-(1,2-epoxy-1,2-dihydrophenyl)acetyl-CoA isomerase